MEEKFEVKTIELISLQILEILQFMHSNCYVYVDISPKNFVMGRGKLSSKLCVTEFVLNHRLIRKDGKKIPFNEYNRLEELPYMLLTGIILEMNTPLQMI